MHAPFNLSEVLLDELGLEPKVVDMSARSTDESCDYLK